MAEEEEEKNNTVDVSKRAMNWGPREYRGPMWETVTALTLLLAGVDLFMMMHPAAVKTLKDLIQTLTG